MGSENLLAKNGPFFVRVTISQLPTQPLCTSNAAPSTCFRPTEMGYPVGLAVSENFDSSVAKASTARPISVLRTCRAGTSPSSANWRTTCFWMSPTSATAATSCSFSATAIRRSRTNQARASPWRQRRPLPNYDLLQMNYNGGWSDYHALQVKLEKRYTHGLYVLNSVHLVQSDGQYLRPHGDRQRRRQGRQLILDLRSNKGISGYDQPLNDTATSIWELPYGRTLIRANANRVVESGGGWRLSASIR